MAARCDALKVKPRNFSDLEFFLSSVEYMSVIKGRWDD